MNVGRCNLCTEKPFTTPWDSYGVTLMREHFREAHPGILLSAREVFGART